jgi:RNA polymerase sigma-70 factor (ECF subfamily)
MRAHDRAAFAALQAPDGARRRYAEKSRIGRGRIVTHSIWIGEAMTTPPDTDVDALLEHASWARALARSLVRDAHRADDLVQRAWLAALEHPPRSSTPVRGWLAAVMRNFARQDARADERRARREHDVARDECEPPRDTVEAESEMQRRLLEAVRALAEPYRSTIWARYYEGLPPRAIAARDGMPVKTVKTRLHRALAELRTELDREHGGDRHAWLAALLPLAKPPSLSATTLGAILVSTELKVACALVAIVGAIAVWRIASDPATRPSPIVERSAAADSLAGAPTSKAIAASPPTTSGARAVLGAAPTVAPIAAPHASESALVRGRVLSLDREPVPNVAIVVTEFRGSRTAANNGAELATTDADGHFELSGIAGGTELGVRSATWVDVYAARVNDGSAPSAVTLFAARRRPLAGIVVDPERRPIAEAELDLTLAPTVRRDLGAVLDANVARTWRAKSDANGRFALPDAPEAPSQISIEAVGWTPRQIDTPAAPTYDLEIVLQPIAAKHVIVRGRVVDLDHRPVEGALVALGSETHGSRSDGAFEFDLDAMKNLDAREHLRDGTFAPLHDPRTIVAVKRGYLPARAPVAAIDELRAASSPIEFELVLGSSPLTIRGRVVEADGRAAAHVIVRARGETRFGMIYEKTDAAVMGTKTSIEGFLSGASPMSDVTSASDGAFEITGLLDKEYTLAAIDRRTLRVVTRAEVHAGSSGIVLSLPSAEECARVAGRVVSLGGEPIAGVTVHACRDTPEDPSHGIQTFDSNAQTDEHGRFEFAALARQDLLFQIASPSTFIIVRWVPPAGAPLDDLVIAVSRRCHLQIDLGVRPKVADGAIVLDARGERVQLIEDHGNVSWPVERLLITDGRSEVVQCEESARTAVLYSGEREVARVPFMPKPNELVVVTP